MNKNRKTLKYLILALLVFTVLAGVFTDHVNKPLTVGNACTFTNKKCEIVTRNLTLSMEFEQSPIVEEELYINFSLDERWILEKTWLEGVNMYMGKTPLMFEDANNSTRGVTFLGSCNLAEMQWRMYVQVREKDTDNTEILTASFSTYND